MSVYTYVDPREHEEIRARKGEDVWVILNHVRAEKHETFEDFLHEILMPALAHIHPETYNKTRVLHPSIPNRDGTWTYIFLMDPVVPDGMYSVSAILYQFYRPELADKYMQIWTESLACPQVEYDMTQSEW
jgi:hypothetical protein